MSPDNPLAVFLQVQGNILDRNERVRSGNRAQVESDMRMTGAQAALDDRAMVRGIMQRAKGDPAVAIPELLKAGPAGIKLANDLGAIEDRKALAVERRSMGNYRDAQTGELARKATVDRERTGAAEKLAGLYDRNSETWAPQGDMQRPDAILPNDAAAIRAVQEATARGEPFTAGVPNTGAVQGLAIKADPQRAIPEMLRQQREPVVKPAPPEKLVPVQRDGKTIYAPASEASGQEVGARPSARGPVGDSAPGKQQQFAQWRIDTLKSTGMPEAEAQRIVAGRTTQASQKDVASLAARLMSRKNEDLTPYYQNLQMAVRDAQRALGMNPQAPKQAATVPARIRYDAEGNRVAQ